MGDAMVTARMPQEKKDAVARILKEQGMSASEAINELYDAILREKAFPLRDAVPAERRYSMDDVLNALDLIESISLPEESELSGKSYDEIREMRLHDAGLVCGLSRGVPCV